MTREQKLALVIGFSVILLVGVLVSDHLSRARIDRVDAVDARDTSPFAAWFQPVDPFLAHEMDGGAEMPAALPHPDASAEMDALAAGPGLTGESAPASASGAAQGAPAPAMSSPVSASGRGSGGDPALLAALRAGMLEWAGAPEPQPAPSAPDLAIREPAPERWHVVAAGESLYRIAAKYYGDGRLWPVIAKGNPGRVGEDGSVREGVRILIPPRDAKPAPASAPAKQAAPASSRAPAYATYTVRTGDTLGEIAQRVLGTSKRWPEIAELNRLGDGHTIRAGMVLRIPAG